MLTGEPLGEPLCGRETLQGTTKDQENGKVRAGEQGGRQHWRLDRSISCPWKSATVSANLVLSLVAPLSLIFIWILYLVFPLSEEFPGVVSKQAVIISYEVLLQAAALFWSGVSLGARALMQACGMWVTAFSRALSITFPPDL